MVFFSYEAGSKAYRMFDPVQKKLHVSRDVVFNEKRHWQWDLVLKKMYKLKATSLLCITPLTMQELKIRVVCIQCTLITVNAQLGIRQELARVKRAQGRRRRHNFHLGHPLERWL